MKNSILQLGTDLTNSSAVDKYEGMYGDYIQICSESMKEKFGYNWTDNDTLAFGRYADTWQEYRPYFEADVTTRNALGEPLASNLGLVAMAYSALPIQNLASVQPLNEEAGVVYFRNAIAAMDRGEVKEGDSLLQPLGSVNPNIPSYVSETQTQTITITDPANVTYTGTLGKEMRPGYVRINIGGGKIKGMDDGEGHVIGVGINANVSTVNYETGEFALVLQDPASFGLAADDTIDITYSQSTIGADEIPTMKWVLDSKVVRAEYDVLQSQYSNIAEIVLRKRFGADLSDQISMDLVTQITSAIMFKAIRKLRNAALLNETILGESLTWNMTAPEGVSDADYRKTFDDRMADAVDMMFRLAGKGEISTIVVGLNGKKVLRTAGMSVVRNAVAGPHLCGMYGDIPVYYAPNSAIGKNEMLVIYRGANWYEAPLVYAPFLPVTLQSGRSVRNVLTNAQAVYHAAALETVMGGFSIRITLQ